MPQCLCHPCQCRRELQTKLNGALANQSNVTDWHNVELQVTAARISLTIQQTYERINPLANDATNDALNRAAEMLHGCLEIIESVNDYLNSTLGTTA
jgi:hypothetical protein